MKVADLKQGEDDALRSLYGSFARVRYVRASPRGRGEVIVRHLRKGLR